MGFAIDIPLPIRISLDQPMSVEDFWRISAENPDLRVERAATGELIVMTPTLGGASFRNAYVIRALGTWADIDGKGSVLESNAGCQLSDGSVLCPDAAWISHARWVPPSPDEADNAVPCPEFVIELRSSTDRLKPLREKMEVWLANGAELAWLIDPSRKAVEIYRPHRDPEILEGGSVVEGEGPVAGFVLELGRIWT
jgi:Uma2 family endonuclease